MSQLFILAVDQRPWLTNALFGHTHSVSASERALTTEAKHMVFEALLSATTATPSNAAGILVDAELGPGVAERAKHAGLKLIIPVEKAGLRVYETEFPNLDLHLQHYEPDFAKVLVRYNPEDPSAERALQRQRLAEVAAASERAGTKFLFELLVPPAAGKEADAAFEALRPELTRAAMREIATEVDVDVWKLEPQGDAESYREADKIARELGGTCVLLGAGRPLDEVVDWIRTASQAGFEGFAVGRTLWWDSVQMFRRDPSTRSAGVQQIADRYAQCVAAFNGTTREP